MASPANITTLPLPGIGRLLQWRADGHWRDLTNAQHHDEQAGAHLPAATDWIRWTGSLRPQAHGGDWGGVATWWLLCGELPADATAGVDQPGHTTPTVRLADGTTPAVLRVGGVWGCEWHSVARPATVQVGGERFDFAFTEPRYRRSAG